MATLKFLGAAQEVTGSCYLLESPGLGKVLLECGMHQGGSAVERIAKDNFKFTPTEINAVILSHVHLDHCGLLPKLVNQGFDGPIYCTGASAELMRIMLEDSVSLYLRDLEKKNLSAKRRGVPQRKAEYSKADVSKVLTLCVPYAFRQPFQISEHASVTFHDAGHILGSAIVEINLKEKQKIKKLVFSGDLGNKNAVLMKDPAILREADVVLMESTYGNRNHRTIDDTVAQLTEILHDTWKRGGNVMIPAFAVGRTQEILFYLGHLHQTGQLDDWQIVLDSPMAIEVTKVYDHWFSSLDRKDTREMSDNKTTSLRSFVPQLMLSVKTQDSMAINDTKKGLIIIAGSGMCTGGRIRHHFKQRIWDKKNTVIFAGFQAKGTLGRIIVEGEKHIKIFGDEYIVRANIETLGGFSAHAGQKELLEWAANFTNKPRVILVHGEAEAQEALSQKLWDEQQIDAEIPSKGSSISF